MLSLFIKIAISSRHRHRPPLTNAASAITTLSTFVYSGPGMYYMVLGTIRAYQTVPITGRTDEWWKINYKGQEGYINSEFLSVPGIVSSSSGLNIRSGPSTIYDIVDALPSGASINIIKVANNWYKISNGWVSGEYVTITGDSSYSEPPKRGEITDSQMQQMGWINYNLEDLNKCIQKFDITTSQRIRHFIAQCSHVSSRGREVKEICSGTRYEGNKDLGNIKSGDGPRYKGAGYLHMKGRSYYQAFANYMGDQGIMKGADYVAEHYPWRSAGFWWKSNKMNNICDAGASVDQVTKIVNDKMSGLEECKRFYSLACKIF